MHYFEYLLDRLLKWHKEYNPDTNDFSVLKSIKLLFFVTAAKTKAGEENVLLDEVFSEFYAMPLGPVESQVYDRLKNNNILTSFQVDNVSTNIINEYNIPAELDDSIVSLIDDSINYIKNINPGFINYSAFQLVEISHSWHSWAKTYSEAQILESRSKKIDNNLIKEDLKIYSL